MACPNCQRGPASPEVSKIPGLIPSVRDACGPRATMYGTTVPLADLDTVAHAAAAKSITCRCVRLGLAALLALTGRSRCRSRRARRSSIPPSSQARRCSPALRLCESVGLRSVRSALIDAVPRSVRLADSVPTVIPGDPTAAPTTSTPTSMPVPAPCPIRAPCPCRRPRSRRAPCRSPRPRSSRRRGRRPVRRLTRRRARLSSQRRVQRKGRILSRQTCRRSGRLSSRLQAHR